MKARDLLGFRSWDPYCGLTPEDYATRQHRRRIGWLVILVLGGVRLVWKFLPG